MATLAYLPFNFFCWLSPIATAIFGITGLTITKMTPEEQAAAEAAEALET